MEPFDNIPNSFIYTVQRLQLDIENFGDYYIVCSTTENHSISLTKNQWDNLIQILPSKVSELEFWNFVKQAKNININARSFYLH